MPKNTQFKVNVNRFDPYKNFRFRIKWDEKYVAGISKVSGIKRTTEVVIEPCPECGAAPGADHASWCLAEEDEELEAGQGLSDADDVEDVEAN